MYPPQYNLPPINPAAFGGLPQERPQGAPPLPSQGGGQQPIDMNKYLMNKVAEIRKRMGAGEMGALTAISDAAQVSAPQQPPMQGPPQQQGMA